MKTKRKKQIKYLRIVLIIAIIVIAIMSFNLLKTFSRYIYNNIKDYYLESKDFYFNSDKLKQETAIYEVDNWSGVEDYKIKINMNSQKNNNVFSTSDVEYTIEYTCSDNINCRIVRENGVIPHTTNTDEFEIIMTPNRFLQNGESVWVEITTKSVSPYKKTLKGKFTINVGNMGMSYEITDQANSQYLELAVTNTLNYYTVEENISNFNTNDQITIDQYLNLSDAEKAKCHSMIIKLQFSPNQVLLDNTVDVYRNSFDLEYEQINGYNYIKSISFKIDAESSNNIKFYKVNTRENYTYPFITENPIINVQYR